MGKFTIRPLRKDDLNKLLELLHKREELDSVQAEKRLELVEWTAFHNPFAKGEPTYYVAEDNNGIVAHLGRMPTIFNIEGESHRGYFVHDLFVDPNCRQKGHGFFLSNSLYRIIEQESEEFCCLIWTSELNLDMQRKRGYYELAAGRYVKIFNPIEKLQSLIKSASVLWIAKNILKIAFEIMDVAMLAFSKSNIKIETIKRFDSRFDSFQKEIGIKIGISTIKTTEFLNWKYVDRPFTKNQIIASERQGKLTGFLVMAPNSKKIFPEGAIVDIMADPDDSESINALIKEAISHFKKEKVYSIECILTDKRFIKLFKKFLFLKAKHSSEVMLSNLNKTGKRDILVNIDQWHLCYGESDETMLGL